MEEHENLYEKIQEILGGTQGRLKILEQQIDMDLQVEYYECSMKLKEEYNDDWAMEKAKYLHEPGYSLEVKKEILARLASTEKVEAYRIIESFLQKGEEELRDWSMLALNENRMLLESKLLDESQVFISTGLGGRDEKLRYFVVLLSRSNLDLSASQLKVIRNEFDYILDKFEAEVEEIKYSENMASVLLLVPMDLSLTDLIHEAINECNKYGDFLNADFIVTNVKTLSFSEIKNFLQKKDEKD